MSTLRTEIKSILTGDATLMAILTGSVFTSEDLDRHGMTLEDAPKESNGVNLKPFAVLRFRGAQNQGPHFSGRRQTLEIYFYQDSGYDKIDAAKLQVESLLHRKYIPSTTQNMFGWVEYVSDLGETVDEQLGGAPADMSRYTILFTRK